MGLGKQTKGTPGYMALTIYLNGTAMKGDSTIKFQYYAELVPGTGFIEPI
jgi:hypothetical protein